MGMRTFPTLTEPEARYVVSVLDGIALAGEWTLVANLAVPMDRENPGWDHLDQLLSTFDGRGLLRTLDSWTPDQRIALIQAAESFWSFKGPIKARLYAAGMIDDPGRTVLR